MDQDESIRVQREELMSIIERYEALENTKKEIMEDQRDLMKEAKYRGYDPKAIKKIIKLRKMDPNQRYEEQAIIETYMEVLGLE
ncbi:MAG: DUF2312 domain-containing protein [Gammaproteobacteria bacterium]|nr:MAG: DUF2312 domain-containing protein [Gammaproteobacteria bacterium]